MQLFWRGYCMNARCLICSKAYRQYSASSVLCYECGRAKNYHQTHYISCCIRCGIATKTKSPWWDCKIVHKFFVDDWCQQCLRSLKSWKRQITFGNFVLFALLQKKIIIFFATFTKMKNKMCFYLTGCCTWKSIVANTAIMSARQNQNFVELLNFTWALAANVGSKS